jgi:hypothetical protein
MMHCRWSKALPAGRPVFELVAEGKQLGLAAKSRLPAPSQKLFQRSSGWGGRHLIPSFNSHPTLLRHHSTGSLAFAGPVGASGAICRSQSLRRQTSQ